MLNPHQFPPEFGTTPVPEGTVRFNHYTHPDAVESIAEKGLQRKHSEERFARGGTESPQVFATAGRPREDMKYTHTLVEGYAHPEQLDIGSNYLGKDPVEHAKRLEGYGSVLTFHGDVPPEQITAIHQPWHAHARYILNDPRMVEEVKAGVHDDLLDHPDYAPAIEHVKRHG
jgi:hypothetical protein